MSTLKVLLSTAAVAAVLAAAPASAAYTLANSNGGDGFVIDPNPPELFTLFGSDNGASNNVATYTTTATSAKSFTFAYHYHTDDVDGAFYDRAGYIINGVQFQVSPGGSGSPFDSYGSLHFTVSPGDTYGFYVDSTDGVLGRGSIGIAVPEPATWAMLIAGFGLTGAAMRRRTATTVAA